jgi:hypothetical protein
LVEGLARVLVYSYVLGLILMVLGIPYFLVGYLAAVNYILPDWVGNFFIIVYGIGLTWLPFAGVQGIVPWFYISYALPSSPDWQLVAAGLMVPVILVQYAFTKTLYRAAKTDEIDPLKLAGYHHLVFAFISGIFLYYAVGPLVAIIGLFLNLVGFQGFRSAVNQIRENRELNRPRSSTAPVPGGKPISHHASRLSDPRARGLDDALGPEIEK